MSARSLRQSMIAGMAFAVLFFVGITLFFSGTPDTSGDSADAIATRALKTIGDSGHRTRTLLGAYLLILAALALVWFVLGLREKLREAGDGTGLGPQLVSAFGMLAAGSLAIGAALGATVAGNISFGGEPVPASGELAWLLPEIGTPLLVLVFGLAMAACITTVTVLVLSTGVLPRWVGYLGILGALGGIGGVIFVPLLLVVLWALGTGIAGVMSRPAEVRATSTLGATPSPA